MTGTVATDVAGAWLDRHAAELVEVRRLIHAHPELGREEQVTTALLVERLTAAGLAPTVFEGGSGVVCDVGDGDGPLVVLRADIDALPLADEKDVPYRSQVPGVCHACGHDVHTAVVLGAGLALAAAASELGGRVRLLFQHAEELMPGGAIEVIRAGWVDGATAIFALHCDPALDVGRVGLKSGPLTAAADAVEVRFTGAGGHTSRPHNTTDLVHVLATVATGLPEALSRLVDPRAGLCLVWGHASAGVAVNAIPTEGVLKGTLRVLDKAAWENAPALVRHIVAGLVQPYGASAEVIYERGVPPVVNDPAATALLTAAVRTSLGHGAAVATAQSLGGEDYGWYLEKVPGAMARLGVKPLGQEHPHDLHQGRFDVDEDALAVGVRVLVAAALAALDAT
ncbi:MAG TPA: amidohydrolase [Mycobacteriales bacterium]|nr:amidohydrolase [Mycobacteriales bacterium]